MEAITTTGDVVEATCEPALETQPRGKMRRFVERGLTTVEYAIGLLAAAALALVLLRIFNDNTFFETMFNWVVGVFGKVSEANGGTLADLVDAVLGS